MPFYVSLAKRISYQRAEHPITAEHATLSKNTYDFSTDRKDISHMILRQHNEILIADISES